MVCKYPGSHSGIVQPYSFNPCYVGLWSVSSLPIRPMRCWYMFQSLLCWIMVCKLLPKATIRWALKFQSLLCWIMVCKSPTLVAPCMALQFQSLLCWIMVCKWYCVICHMARPPGFNPCYVGLWSVRTGSPKDYLYSKLFQSLLCWIMVCKRCGGSCFCRLPEVRDQIF